MKNVLYVPFGIDFIKAVHDHLAGSDIDLTKTSIVFPGKRPSLYFKKAISEYANVPVFSPRFFSIEEFIDNLARKIDPEYSDIGTADAIWFLYECIQSLRSFENHPFRKKHFGEFFWWGRYLLQFINQLDTENIDNEILTSLERNAQLGYDVPESTNELLVHVTELRDAFHETLRNNRFFSRGQKEQRALEYIKGSSVLDSEEFCFAGIFALSSCEKLILRHLWNSGKAQVILEGDPSQWPILAELVSFLGSESKPIGKDRFSGEISIYSGIDTHSEVLAAHQILAQSRTGKTAVILPEPEALFPLMSFALDRIDMPYNISLGYPLWRTSLFDLVSHLLDALSGISHDGGLPVNEYLSIMFHPFVKNLRFDEEVRPCLSNLKSIFTESDTENSLAYKPFVSVSEIEEKLGLTSETSPLKKIHDVFFRDFQNANAMGEYARLMEELLDFILHNTPIRSYVLSEEIFRRTFEVLDRLQEVCFAASPLHRIADENRRIICDLIREHLKSIEVPFDTTPIEDIEVIGVLESRNISFDTVVMLDVNEGSIPRPRTINPLIPLGIYASLGIPSPEYNEEIYRYYFYRLIRSAHNVHLIYADSEERPRSRYIEQLIWEQEIASRKINSVRVNKSERRIHVRLAPDPPVLAKTASILNVLRNKAYSPAAIDDYVTCPVLFYHKHILAFDQAKGLPEDIEGVERGRIIHAVLHDTFKSYIGVEITPDMFDSVLNTTNTAIDQVFGRKQANGDYYLFRKMAAFKLETFLRKHVKEADSPFIPKQLEARLEGELTTHRGSVRLKGFVDRIDYRPMNKTYEIIDYKTGGELQYSGKALNIDFGSIEEIHKYVKSFQLPIYVHLFGSTSAIPFAQIDARLILLRNNTEETFLNNRSPAEKESDYAKYMKGVVTVMEEILDPEKPLTVFDTVTCSRCTFSNLCHV
ncbi:MAG TPA: PD-(D/E)XK nuclease family protein [Syntrophorhabdaceae bacterium]|nr:PD-(D/E)XK nuclease family protein [Syntrophorhabdaceae bacterium]